MSIRYSVNRVDNDPKIAKSNNKMLCEKLKLYSQMDAQETASKLSNLKI